MKIAYFDTVGGIAGDMTLAAFVSAGMPFERLSSELSKLAVDGFRLSASHVRRNSIDAVHCEVIIAKPPTYHRHLPDILEIIERSSLTAGAKKRASSIFRVIASAEAAVHNIPLEKVHFHEVGALDSIVDIVGTAICLDELDIDAVYSSPVKLGSGGTVMTQHGVMPIPAPATLEILKDYPVVMTGIPHELTTPTGAAIIKAFSVGTLKEETLRVRAVGYGAGTKEFAEIPNLVRIVIGDLVPHTEHDDVVAVETNIDDMNPQIYPHVIDLLLDAGAHDAYLVPVVMKKGRPGILLSVLVNRNNLEAVIECIYRETSTIGIRIHEVGRRKLPRRRMEISTSFGIVQAKAVIRDGREVITPEFEECKRIARERGLAVALVMRRIEQDLLLEDRT